MNESSQAIVAVKREVQLSEWQRQVQERQEQGIPVDEWCASLGISKGAYYRVPVLFFAIPRSQKSYFHTEAAYSTDSTSPSG